MTAPWTSRPDEGAVGMRGWAEILEDIQRNAPVYISMPFIAAAIGWFTKLVAIRMMFRPHKFRGIGPLGWQGIIPRRSAQMVDVLCQTLTGRLINNSDIVDRLDGKELAKRIERPMRKEMARLVPIVAEEYQPALWRLLPGPARDMVVQRAQDASTEAVPKLVKAIRRDIDEIFNLQEMVTAEFLADPDILERMFLDVGRREFSFIRRSGLAFGFVIGTLQAAIWAIFHEPLVMPLFGLFIGWFTDWAALRLIFNPKEPTKYLGVVTWQGLFLKHRIPVSEEYGVLIATRVLTSDRIVRSMFTGPRREEVVEVFTKVIEKTLRTELVDGEKQLRRELSRFDLGPLQVVDGKGSDPISGLLGLVTGTVTKPLKQAAGIGLDAAQVKPMARMVATELVAAMPEILTPAYDHLDGVLAIKETMAEKMVAMTPDEFEGVLRPAFQADERTLIIVGAILGFLVGELQVLLVEHLSH
jgi:uncharacterized membrane protein YheB (UPF0754 family)